MTVRPTSVTVRRAERLALGELEIPGDFSSAAPFIVAATLVPGSELHVHGVNLNPRRTGLLGILDRMGARITSYNRRLIGGEPAGDLEIHAAPLVGTTVEAQEVPLAIDELPLVALAAACARGETVIRGAAELRAKETDRIEATVDALRALGVRAQGRRTVFACSACLRAPAAAGSRAGATTGSPCSAPSPASPRARAFGSTTQRRSSVSFPGFFEMLDELRRASAVVEDDRR